MTEPGAEAGARRTGLGSTLNRAALGAFPRAGRESLASGSFSGSFGFMSGCLSYAEATACMPEREARDP